MNDKVEFEFSIDALTPDTLSMRRLAEYLKALSSLMGVDSSVFRYVEEGSAILKQDVLESSDVVQVIQRIDGLRQNSAPAEAEKAFQDLNRLLKHDNAVGRFRLASGHLAANADLYFPGREIEGPEPIYAVAEEGQLDGTLILIGGKDDSVPVHIQHKLGSDGVYKCTCNRALAREMAKHLFSDIRVAGVGDWVRDEKGEWKCKKFKICDYWLLQQGTLAEGLDELGKLIGSDIGELKKPTKFINDSRED
ncbi:hypothetical protein [Neptunomonas japonica]|uniref:hypothetical protein n=1 Tax=Neptunomonas japonica TaxID=417574 RepID=UPI000421BD7C|nr:hypothetical protein [Neptunomonas japonica]